MYFSFGSVKRNHKVSMLAEVSGIVVIVIRCDNCKIMKIEQCTKLNSIHSINTNEVNPLI